MALSIFMLSGCGKLSKNNSKVTSGSSSSAVTDSTFQTTGQDIEKMLSTFQNDKANITTDDGTPNATDSAINDINSALQGSQDNITGLN